MPGLLLPADKLASLVKVLDMGVFVTLASVAVITVVGVVVGVRRMIRRQTLDAGAGSAAARPSP